MAILNYKWFFLLYSFFPDLSGAVSCQADLHPHPHPLYISITEITHNATANSLEISCKIFTDDFEKALQTTYNKKTDLSNPANKAEAEKLVAGYIKKQVVLKVDGKPVTLDFVGFERERDVIWSYFEVPHIGSPKKIEAINKLLYETYDAQINLMHVTVGGNRKSTKLNYPETDAKFDF